LEKSLVIPKRKTLNYTIGCRASFALLALKSENGNFFKIVLKLKKTDALVGRVNNTYCKQAKSFENSIEKLIHAKSQLLSLNLFFDIFSGQNQDFSGNSGYFWANSGPEEFSHTE
jgi:hypothetical protein